MKKYAKEESIAALQLLLFYGFPLFCGPTDVMGMVFLCFAGTFLLAFLWGLLSAWEWKACYPAVTAIAFIPTIPIYYNFTAAIYILYYLVIGTVGMYLGWGLRKLFKIGK